MVLFDHTKNYDLRRKFMGQKPYISSDIKLPEITLKSVLLGIILSMVLAGANAYLGLFAGMTVSASIPAAVISMAILKMFPRHNILENNAVQTSASAGESLAAGVIFTFPALVLMGYWKDFNYIETTFIALCGGVLGVMFTVPLRQALIVNQGLPFPEGTATAEVLKSGNEGGSSIKYLIISSIIGAFFKFFEAGAKLWNGVFDKATLLANKKAFVYFGINLSPALMAVGYIIGLNVSVLVFIGGAISWWIAIPAYVAYTGVPDNADAVSLGYKIWSTQIRYLGVGAMVVGGLWALISLKDSLKSAIQQGIDAFQKVKDQNSVLRTEEDTPMNWIFIGIAFMILPIFMIYYGEIEIFSLSGFMTIFMIITGFLFSAVAGYMAGLVGSSNNPISGVTIATILTSAFMLLLFLGTGSAKGPAAAIMIGAVVCCAAAIAGDNMQDLKAGHVLGATPKKQQIMQMIGVVAAAVVMAPVLTLLNTAYGFGPKTAEHPDSLTAPQATLMQSVAEGVFGGNLPWNMIATGAILGVVIILIDQYLKAKNSSFRMPVLAVAVGLYLPFELDSAIMLGGLIAWLIQRFQKMNKKTNEEDHNKSCDTSNRSGLLFASGLITGEALVGILLAVPVAMTGKSDVFALVKTPFPAEVGLVLLMIVCITLYKLVKKQFLSQNS